MIFLMWINEPKSDCSFMFRCVYLKSKLNINLLKPFLLITHLPKIPDYR